jgi:hypothetical protein
MYVSTNPPDGSHASSINKVVGAEGRLETLLAHAAEVWPCKTTNVDFQDVVPLLDNARQVVRGKPNLVRLQRHLSAEKQLTLNEPAKRVLSAVVGGEHKFVIL